MTPARLAEIRAYIARLDLDQLPGWTIEQRIIADLWEELEAALADRAYIWDQAYGDGRDDEADSEEDRANPYYGPP